MKNDLFRPFSSLFERQNERVWQAAFWVTLVGYLIFYVPFGIDELDAGFMTSYAWQVFSGKTLYSEVLYVRQPLPVWLRVAEIWVLPDRLETLGERLIFYLKMAGFCWLAADLLASGGRKWQLATFGFVVSAHNYTPISLHTFDGILFSVLAFWGLRKNLFWATFCAFAAMLCKQSFYPIAVVFLFAVFFQKGKMAAIRSALLLAVLWSIFYSFLIKTGVFNDYLKLLGGASDVKKLIQAGVFAYFRINPMVAFGAAICLFPIAFWGLKSRFAPAFLASKNAVWQRLAGFGWAAFLGWLAVSFSIQVFQKQDFLPPFHQSRLLFWVAIFCSLFQFLEAKGRLSNPLIDQISLLAVCWCASIGWGYQLPVQFAVPGVFAAFLATEKLCFGLFSSPKKWLAAGLAVWLGLLATFRWGHEFVYADGRRGEMTEHLGAVFPQLTGIFSTVETRKKFQDLKDQKARFGEPLTVLPIFAQADFWLQQRPVLPTNWLVNRETSGHNSLIFKELDEKKPVILIEKSFEKRLSDEPEFSATAEVMRQKTRIGESEFFWIYR